MNSISKILCSIIFSFLTIGVLDVSAFSGAGTGTGLDPYQITTCAQLQEIQNGESFASYEIQNDIDCSETETWNDGLGFDPIGTLAEPATNIDIGAQGAGVVISNLFINRPLEDNVGILGYVVGEIGFSNIGLKNVHIVGKNNVGAFVGNATTTAGGDIGWMVQTYVDGGSVTGQSYVGGIMGRANGTIIDGAYSNAVIAGSSNTGGIIGYGVNLDMTGASSYYDSETSGQSDVGKGTAKTTAQMKQIDTYVGWDFDAVWGIIEGDTYPYIGNPGVAYFAGGTGTEEDPYQINSCITLQNMNTDLDAYYELISDIDCSETETWNEGSGFVPVGSNDMFSGTLNGNEYTISNLFIDVRGTESTAGLFYLLGSSHIYDVAIVDAQIYSDGSAGIVSGETTLDAPRVDNTVISNVTVTGTIQGVAYVGGMIGSGQNVIISDSHSNVVITNPIAGEIIGGLIGDMKDSDIIRSYATGTISAHSESTKIGGLVGKSLNGSIFNSYADVDLSGYSIVGGLVGFLDTSDVENSYSIGSVVGEGGGLVGVIGNSSIISSYYDTDTSLKSDTDKGTPKNTADMKISTTFTNWDFDSVWGIVQAESYPYLNNPGLSGQLPETENRPRTRKYGSSRLVGNSPVMLLEDTTQIPKGTGGSKVSVEQAEEALLAITKNFERNLTIGLEGEDVLLLQYFLISKNTGPSAQALAEAGATGYFGKLTLGAVVEFQKAHAIEPALGFVGSITRGVISKMLNLEYVEVYIKLGSSSDEVKKIQEFLISKNTGPSAQALAEAGATGYFGKLTLGAVVEFQKAHAIVGEDGYIGPKTMQLLK